MVMLKRVLLGLWTIGFAVAALMPTRALAWGGVEGGVVGDQGFYWFAPGQVWIFPHTLGNIDNRVMLQLGSPDNLPLEGSGVAGLFELQNQLPIQNEAGMGFTLELMENLNIGVWISAFTPAVGDFIDDAIVATQWDTYVGDPAAIDNQTDDLEDHDPFDPAGGSLVGTVGDDLAGPGRKLDAFASYWLPDLKVEAGAHLWYGSTHHKLKRDEHVGPIDIDEDSDPASGDTVGEEETIDVNESVFRMRETGVGIGAGYTGIENLRADAGLEFGMVGITWNPSDYDGQIDKYLDAGGKSLAANLRAHYQLSDKLTVGGFFRVATQGLSFEPLKQRDGGNLPGYLDDEDDTLGNPNGSYPTGTGDPDDSLNELTPVEGTKYETNQTNMQIAGIARWTPNSRVKLYTGIGFVRDSSVTKTSIGDDKWFSEETSAFSTLPFINVGFEGKVFEHMDLMLGAVKRWRGETRKNHFFDDRIPDNSEGPGGVDPADPQADFTNENRRDIEETASVDRSQTQLMVGTRIHYGPIQVVGQIQPNNLLDGPFLASGVDNPLFIWMNLIYDWDYDTDIVSGNGSIMGGAADPHKPGKSKKDVDG
jgi:hypothetical protein